MRKMLLAVVLTVAGLGTAQAQYYPPPPRYVPPPPPPVYVPPPYLAPGYAAPRYVASGNSCYTSRGNCGIYTPRPLNSSCTCDIPGFGFKRGFVIP